MFLIQSEKQLIDSFFPKDQRRLELPQGMRYPLVVRDYFAWGEPGGSKVFLLFAEPGAQKPIGIVFEREHPTGTPTAAICEWCHSFGSSNQIGLLTLEVTPRRRVGVQLCRDLSCRQKIEMNLSLSPLAAQARSRRVVEEMSRLVRRLLL